MSIEKTREVQEGKCNGSVVWVCHYNQPDLGKKPLRNVPPTKCIVACNSELPKNKKVYYSKSHFRVIGKNDKVTAKIISPVDNTGYRSYQGNPLSTFLNKEDCECDWNDMLSIVEIKLTDELESVEGRLKSRISSIRDMII